MNLTASIHRLSMDGLWILAAPLSPNTFARAGSIWEIQKMHSHHCINPGDALSPYVGLSPWLGMNQDLAPSHYPWDSIPKHQARSSAARQGDRSRASPAAP